MTWNVSVRSSISPLWRIVSELRPRPPLWRQTHLRAMFKDPHQWHHPNPHLNPLRETIPHCQQHPFHCHPQLDSEASAITETFSSFVYQQRELVTEDDTDNEPLFGINILPLAASSRHGPSHVLGLGSGPQVRQAQPKKSPAQPDPVVGPMRAQGCQWAWTCCRSRPGAFSKYSLW